MKYCNGICTWACFCLFAMLACAMAGCGSKPAELKLDLEAGKAYTINAKESQQMQMTVAGRSQDISTSSDTTFAIEVKSKDPDGTMHVGARVERISMVTPMGTFTVDAANPSANTGGPMAEMLGGMVGKEELMKISATGVVSSAGPSPSQGILSGPAPGSGQSADAGLMSAMAGGPQTREMMANLFAFPSGPVKVSDTWSRSEKFGSGMFSVPLETEYKLTALNDDVAKVAIDAAVPAGTPPQMMEMGPIQGRISLSGTQSGSMEIDRRTGIIRSAEVKNSFKGETTMGSLTEGSMTIPMSIEQTVTLSMAER